MNGEEDEAVKVVQEMKEKIETHEAEEPASNEKAKRAEDSGSGEIVDAEDEEGDNTDSPSAEETVEVAKPRRGRSSKKKA